MRIAFLNPSGQLGGAERVLLDIIASIKEERPEWEIHLIAGEDGPLIHEAGIYQAISHVSPFPKSVSRLGDAFATGSLFFKLLSSAPSLYGYATRLKSMVNRIKPDIVHSNGLKMDLITAWLKVGPLFWHVHDYVSSRPVANRLLNCYVKRCEVVITNSNSVALDFRRTIKHTARVVPLQNGIDLKRFSPQGESMDLDAQSRMPHLNDGVIRIGLLSTFARWKGHEVFLKALSLIPREIKYRGYIIGGPVYQTEGSQRSTEEIKQLAEKYNVMDKIGFTGFVLRPETAIRALDIVVHASTRPEPFGLVIAEAMACGRPLIASYAGGASEIINSGVNALIHEPGDATALAGQIAALIKDPGLRQKLGSAGRATAVEMFDRTRLGRELIALYEEITTKGKYANPERS